MAITVAQLLLDIESEVPDAGNYLAASNSYILGLINSVHQQLCIDCQLLSQNTIVAVLPVASQYTYTLPTTVKRIWSVYYQPSAGTTQWPLIATSQDELDETIPGWRDTTIVVQTPGYYFSDAGNLGVYPIPSASAVGGYPVYNVYCTEIPVLAAGDSLPSNVARDTAWVYGVAVLHCMKYRPEDVPRYKALYNAEKQNLLRSVNGLIARAKSSIRTYVPPTRGH